MRDALSDIYMSTMCVQVWAVPTTHMQCSWLGERVATANVAKVVENVLRNKTESGWGPNAVFRFPQEVCDVGRHVGVVVLSTLFSLSC